MAVKRYRITADVYAFEDQMTDERQRLIERRLRDLVAPWFPLGMIERYPQIDEIAADSPFETTDADAQPRDVERRTL